MINILGKIPRKVAVALSGGVDSVAIHDFLSRKHEVEILYFNHGKTDESANLAQEFAERCAEGYSQKITIGNVSRDKHKSESMEEYWRNMRYEWMHGLPNDFIVVGHHLNDVVETWVWSSMHGHPRVIPYKRGNNVYRPFLINKKKELGDWVAKNQLAYLVDKTNDENDKMRNYIRNVMMPHCKHVNPGIEKVVKEQILKNSMNELYEYGSNEFENLYV